MLLTKNTTDAWILCVFYTVWVCVLCAVYFSMHTFKMLTSQLFSFEDTMRVCDPGHVMRSTQIVALHKKKKKNKRIMQRTFTPYIYEPIYICIYRGLYSKLKGLLFCLFVHRLVWFGFFFLHSFKSSNSTRGSWMRMCCFVHEYADDITSSDTHTHTRSKIDR